MQVIKLDHVNIRTTQLEAMIDWYTDILGLHNGFRPNSSSEGAWLYAGDSAIVHLVRMDKPEAVGSESSLKLEHFSLRASGLVDFESKLHEAEEKYERVELPAVNLVLYNVWDPDGNHIHVDFELAQKN